MTRVATPRTEATPAATPAGAVEHRRQSHPTQGGGRCRGREGHETKLVGTGRRGKGNPANSLASKKNNDLPHSTSMDNHVNTHTTVAVRARKLPLRPKSGKPAGTGRPAPTTYVAKPKKIAPSGTWSTSTRTTKSELQSRAIPTKTVKIVISDSWRTALNKSRDRAVHNQGGI